jgi:hypothetical protein
MSTPRAGRYFCDLLAFIAAAASVPVAGRAADPLPARGDNATVHAAPYRVQLHAGVNGPVSIDRGIQLAPDATEARGALRTALPDLP